MNFILCKFFLLLIGVCIYITYQIKKCVYNIIKKKRIYMCMWGCLNKYIKVIVWPQTKIPDSVPGGAEPKTCDIQ